MKTQDIDKKIKETKLLLEKLETQKKEQQAKKEIEEVEYIDIPELGISISNKLVYLNKTYSEILKLVKEENIADYPLLQKLRNEGKESNWKKYSFLKEFYAYVPNPDLVSKLNGYVAVFYAYSYWSDLYCDGGSGCRNSDRGVFLIKKMEKNK